MKEVLILNSNDFNSGVGGQASFIKNLHPYLEKKFKLKYLVLPPIYSKQHILPLRFLYLFSVIFFLIKNRKKYNLIISHSPEASFVASFFHIPMVHIFHGNINPLVASTFWYGKYFIWVFNLFEKRIINKASLLYTVGEPRKGAKKILNPIPHFDIQKTCHNRKHFVFAGRLEEVKNVDLIINVYNSLSYDIKDKNNLYIIGSGSKEFKLRKLVDRLNLNKNIIFKGQLSNEETIKYISNSIILLMASSHEGFPMVIAESLSVGTPVISTNVGDIASRIKNNYNGFLLPVDFDFNLYIEKISIIINNFESFSINAKKSAQVFQAKLIANSLINDCNKIIS